MSRGAATKPKPVPFTRRKARYRDESFSIDGVRGYAISTHGDPGNTWTDGHVFTPTHLIVVYSQDGHTRLDAVHDGRHLSRLFSERFTARGLSILAGRFARDLRRIPPSPAAGRKGRGK